MVVVGLGLLEVEGGEEEVEEEGEEAEGTPKFGSKRAL